MRGILDYTCLRPQDGAGADNGNLFSFQDKRYLVVG